MGLVTTSRPGSANGRIAADHKTRRNYNPQKTNAQRQSQSRIPVTAMLSSYRVHYGLLQKIPWRGSRRSLGPRSLRNAMRHHANGCYPTDVTENGGTAGTLIFRTTSAATTQIFIPMGGQRPGHLFVRQARVPPCRQTLAPVPTAGAAMQRMLRNVTQIGRIGPLSQMPRPCSAAIRFRFSSPGRPAPGRLNMFAYSSPFAPAQPQPSPLRCHPLDRHSPQKSTQ